MRLLRTALLLSSLVLLPRPAGADGGVVIAAEYGWGLWGLDRAQLERQLPDKATDWEGDLAGLIVDNTHDAQAATLRLGYDVLGHANLEAFLTATGWNLTEKSRGGAGLTGGTLSWHPAQIWLPDRPWDAELFLGYGWGLLGQKKGLSGNAFLWGARGSYFFGKILFLGASVRVHHLLFDEYYRDYDNRAVDGNTLVLPDGSGGTFVTVGLQAGLQIDPMP